MAEKYIRIRGQLVTVTKEVYYTYYHMARQCRTQIEKDGRRQVTSYDALDTNDGLGVELLKDDRSPSVEDMAISHILSEQLHRCIAQLSPAEQKIITALFFENLSERRAAQLLGVPPMTIHDRKIRVIKKLRKMMGK